VEPGAQSLLNVTVTTAAARVSAGQALGLARARDAAAVAVGQAWVLRQDLARCAALGLEEIPAALLGRPLPVVAATASEIAVRRLLLDGAPLVIVGERRRPLGAIDLPELSGRPLPGLGRRLLSRVSAATGALLPAIEQVATAQGTPAFLVGGTVRDALRAGAGRRRDGTDLDIVVEGDGLGFARALAAAVGAAPRDLTEHARFLTASLVRPDGSRIDVATARSERYEVRGALPRVLPATIGLDLARRDFTVNALAVALAGGELALLDPFGGRRDLARRRLRVLHPLSFVEDPTRIFRAARYATRLGFSLDGWTASARALALRLAPYPALSGPRLITELELILGEARPEHTLRQLGAAGAFRLLDARYRFGRRAGRRLGALASALAWAKRRALTVAPVELTVVALVGDQAPAVGLAVLARLGFTGEPLARLQRALSAETAAGAGPPSERARRLASRSDLELAWLWLAGSPAARRVVDWYVMRGRTVRPALRGDELLALGVPAGRHVAEVLTALRGARLDGVLAGRDAEVAYVRDWIERRRKEG
jgi:tRNA nucleotidyltransferase (CCA-adding enzyme)